MRHAVAGLVTVFFLGFSAASAASDDAEKVVAALDTEYQAAVRAHDVFGQASLPLPNEPPPAK